MARLPKGSHKIVFVPEDDLIDERPRRAADRPLRPTPRPLDNPHADRWIPSKKSGKRYSFTKVWYVLRKFSLFVATTATLLGLIFLIKWMLDFYGFNISF